jgi:hypothetical protein
MPSPYRREELIADTATLVYLLSDLWNARVFNSNKKIDIISSYTPLIGDIIRFDFSKKRTWKKKCQLKDSTLFTVKGARGKVSFDSQNDK